MKGLDSILVVVLVFLFCSIKYTSSIICYDCNSAFDPRCGDEFDPFSLGVVNCSLRDPLDHMPDAEPTLCRSIKMDIYGKVRVVRQCGYTTEEAEVPGCRRQTSTGDLFVTYCSCDSDLCNAAPARAANMAATLLVALAMICY